MIIDEEIEVAINGANIKNLESKGYKIPKYYNENNRKYMVKRGTRIKINTLDLTSGSRVEVKVACDYCGKEKMKPYTEYNNSINTNEFVKKYCCEDCDHLKKQEIYEYKQGKGLLKRGNKGYWNFKENIMKELDAYVKEKGNIINMQASKTGACILYAIKDRGLNIDDLCVELGYKLEDIRKNHKPHHYYEDFDNLKNDILGLIKTLNRFPKQKEVLEHLHIGNEILLSFGGIKEIKHRMGHNDENDLVDDRGFRNSSAYEYMTAQYLIENNIPYKREQYPFSGDYKRLRSDFTFFLEDGKEIHTEIWGYSKKDKASKRSVSYNEKRVKKEKMYEESEHILIGIDYEVFQGKYDVVQKRLYEIFNPYVNLGIATVDQHRFIPTNKISDEELLKELMKYSEDGETLPKQEYLTELRLSGLFLEAIKRYGTYFNFAEQMGVKSLRVRHEWDKQSVYDKFDYMITEYGTILKSNELRYNRDRDLRGFETGAKKVFGTILKARISYYEYIISKEESISDKELSYIEDAIHIRKGFNKRYMTKEILDRFKKIYSYYKN
jgi:hypothetical protein